VIAGAYLERIGADRYTSLAELQLRHLMTVPFENLSIHLGEEIVLEEEALIDKIVRRRRGGFCYELNGAFAVLLRELGYDVEMLQARVIVDGKPGIAYDHLALRAGPWLVDVGFGSFTHYPLRIDVRSDQADPAGTFRIVETPAGDLDVLQDGQPQYRLETRPRELSDFAAGCWWHSTSPRSHFTRSLICSRLTREGRLSLSGGRLIATAADGGRTETPVDDVLDAYRRYFSIDLPRVPTVRPAR
jgi:N-hydroxyarylamine O-acetyltransferase